jgi:hypothetical protein
MSITMTQINPTQTPYVSGNLKGAQLWSHRFKLETQACQTAHSHTIHSEFKTICSYLFPLKSWLDFNLVGQKSESHQPLNQLARITLAPDDRNHIGPRGRGHYTLELHQGSAGPLQRSVHAGSYTDSPGSPNWSRHLLQVSISLHQFEGPLFGSTASFSCLEGDPGITS